MGRGSILLFLQLLQLKVFSMGFWFKMATHYRLGTQNLGLLPKKQRVHTPHLAPQLLRSAPERRTPKYLALKTIRAPIHQTRGAMANWVSSRDCVSTHLIQGQYRSSPLKSPQTLCERSSFPNFKVLCLSGRGLQGYPPGRETVGSHLPVFPPPC